MILQAGASTSSAQAAAASPSAAPSGDARAPVRPGTERVAGRRRHGDRSAARGIQRFGLRVLAFPVVLDAQCIQHDVLGVVLGG